jgi:hypothetical protein
MSSYSPGQAAELLDRIFLARDHEQVVGALEAFSEGIEWTQFDVDNRPANPSVARGRGEVASLLEKGLTPGMTHRVVRTLATDEGIACHIECSYPTGDQVQATYMMDVEDGRVSRVIGTMSWDG